MAKETKLAFPREPENSLAAEMKSLTKPALQTILAPVSGIFKTDSRIHQLAAVAIGITEDSFLFAIDMGGGKSKIAIDIFSIRKSLGDTSCAIITCPPIVCNHWAKEIRKHSNCTVTVVEGTPNEKFRIFTEARTDFIVVSHPWLTRLFTDTIGGRVPEDLVRQGIARFDCLIIDEVHRLKSSDSKGFLGYCEFFASIRYRYFLTGTPVGNDFLGLWSIYYLLDAGQAYTDSYHKFLHRWFTVFELERYNKKTQRKFYVPIYRLNKTKQEDFFARFWSKAVRWEESELTDLPEKNYLVIPLGLNVTQRKEYALAVKQHFTADDSPLWDLMLITGGATEAVKNGRLLATKLEALALVIDNICLERDEQLIIWVYRVEEARTIAQFIGQKFKTLPFGEIRAEIPKTQKDKAITNWRTGKNKILIANQGSLGIGVDLYEASTDVFYSNGPSFIDRKQAEKRIHRDGQTKSCLHIDLVCEGTVDEVILEGLNNAAAGFAMLSRDQIWSKIQKTFK